MVLLPAFSGDTNADVNGEYVRISGFEVATDHAPSVVGTSVDVAVAAMFTGHVDVVAS